MKTILLVSVVLSLQVVISLDLGVSCDFSGTFLDCSKSFGRFLNNSEWKESDHIFITDSNMSEITQDDINEFPNVQKITIFNSTLFPMKRNYFGGLRKLKELLIGSCNATDDVQSLISQNYAIKTLDFSKNKIISVNKTFLSHLYLLENLHLSYNKIISIDAEAFKDLNLLKTVNFTYNYLSRIYKGTFTRLRSVENIDLSHNMIEIVEVDSFGDLPSLREINLSENRIGTTFDSSYLTVYPNKCAVCRMKGSHETCSMYDLDKCNKSRVVDELWSKFSSYHLRLSLNPICDAIKIQSEHEKGSSLNSKEIVSSEECIVYNDGSCNIHKSRQYFMFHVCDTDPYVQDMTPQICQIHHDGSLTTIIILVSLTLLSSLLILLFTVKVYLISRNGKSIINSYELKNVRPAVHIPNEYELGPSVSPNHGIHPAAQPLLQQSGNENFGEMSQFTLQNGDDVVRYENCSIVERAYAEIDPHAHSSRQEPRCVSTSSLNVQRSTGDSYISLRTFSTNNSDEEELLKAVRKGSHNDVERMLKNGVDLNCKDVYGGTPFHIASQAGFEKILKTLLQYDSHLRNECAEYVSSVDDSDSVGNTALLIAVRTGRLEIVDLLFQHGVKINAINSNREGVMHIAAFSGYSKIIRLFLRNPSIVTFKELSPNFPNIDGNTPVHLAAMEGHRTALEILLDNGGYWDARNKFGDTPLHLAAWNDRKNVMSVLLNRHTAAIVTNTGPSQVDATNNEGRTSLMNAAHKGHLEAVKLLVKYGANPLLRDTKQNTARVYAGQNEHMDVAKYLVECESLYTSEKVVKSLTL